MSKNKKKTGQMRLNHDCNVLLTTHSSFLFLYSIVLFKFILYLNLIFLSISKWINYELTSSTTYLFLSQMTGSYFALTSPMLVSQNKHPVYTVKCMALGKASSFLFKPNHPIPPNSCQHAKRDIVCTASIYIQDTLGSIHKSCQYVAISASFYFLYQRL